MTAAAVFFTALATALATGLGALPFLFKRGDAGRRLGSANAVASGVMLGASASLLLEGLDRSGGQTAVGVTRRRRLRCARLPRCGRPQ